MTVVEAGWHRLGGIKEKGDRVSNGFGIGIRSGRRGLVEWSKWVEWRGVDWGGRVTPYNYYGQKVRKWKMT